MFRQYSEKLKTFLSSHNVSTRRSPRLIQPLPGWLLQSGRSLNWLWAISFRIMNPISIQKAATAIKKHLSLTLFSPISSVWLQPNGLTVRLNEHHNVNSHVVGGYFDTDLHIPRLRSETEWPNRPLRIAAMIRPNSERRSPRLTMENLHGVSAGTLEGWSNFCSSARISPIRIFTSSLEIFPGSWPGRSISAR